MVVNDEDVEILLVFLSKERMDNLLNLTKNPKDAIMLHQETLVVGSVLMNIIATVEIALRNAICDNLHRFFKKDDWLENPPVTFTWKGSEINKIKNACDSGKRSIYAKLTAQQKKDLDCHAEITIGEEHKSISKKRRKFVETTNGKTIAELTFYFWKGLFSLGYEHSLWKPTLKKLFPQKNIKRADVIKHLEVIYQSRNRLAHHEPVLHQRFTSTIDSITFIIENLGVVKVNSNKPLVNLLSEQIDVCKKKAQQLHERLEKYRKNEESIK